MHIMTKHKPNPGNGETKKKERKSYAGSSCTAQPSILVACVLSHGTQQPGCSRKGPCGRSSSPKVHAKTVDRRSYGWSARPLDQRWRWPCSSYSRRLKKKTYGAKEPIPAGLCSSQALTRSFFLFMSYQVIFQIDKCTGTLDVLLHSTSQ